MRGVPMGGRGEPKKVGSVTAWLGTGVTKEVMGSGPGECIAGAKSGAPAGTAGAGIAATTMCVGLCASACSTAAEKLGVGCRRTGVSLVSVADRKGEAGWDWLSTAAIGVARGEDGGVDTGCGLTERGGRRVAACV